MRYLLMLIVFVVHEVNSQNVTLLGKVEGDTDVENIHITNSSQNKNTTTNVEGVFSIEAKEGDIIKISSIQYENQEIVVASHHVSSKKLVITLKLKVNALDEVVLKRNKLTGNLMDDVNNSTAKRPINFYDVGIPGYTGKPLTQNERRLKDATAGVIFYGTGVNLHKLLNVISGRTKKLKKRVKIETNLEIMKGIKGRLFEDFFKIYPLKEDVIMDFFYFCLEDVSFENRCKGKSDLEIMTYLEERYKAYQTNSNLLKN